MRFERLLATVIVVAALGSRGRAAPPTSQAVPKATAPLDRDTMMRLHMHASFDLLRAIERLLIRGKLDDARRFAATISAPAEAPAHGPWASQLVLVRDRAAAVVAATTVAQACQLEAQLAAACSGCHVQTGGVPRFRAYPPPPPDLPTIGARMARHRWAADRLWEGIVGGAVEPWNAGLEVLAASPLDWSDRGSERAVLAGDLQRDADQARAHSKQASLEARARAYGQMLSTCAACHMWAPSVAPSRR